MENDKLLKLNEVLEVVGCKTTTWYSLIKKGLAPQPLRPFGTNAVRWSMVHILEWIEKNKNNNKHNKE